MKAAAIAGIPTAVLLALYVAFDPMHVIRNREETLADQFLPGKGLLSVSQYELHNPQLNYDSFIIGSSLSCYYQLEDWAKYLPDGSVPYHFDSGGMSIGQMRRSVDYLCRNSDVKNALIISSPGSIANTYALKAAGEKSPITAPALADNAAEFLSSHFKIFQHWHSFGCLNGALSKGVLNQDIKGIDNYPRDTTICWYDSRMNEERNPRLDSIREILSARYLEQHPEAADQSWRPDTAKVFVNDFINGTIENDLRRIAAALRAEGTDYYFVLVTDYEIRLMSQRDMARLHEIFGKHLVDLTLRTAYITRNPYNYFDGAHYRPKVARQIMEMIYDKDTDGR